MSCLGRQEESKRFSSSVPYQGKAVADLDIRHIRNGECQILHPFKNS